MKRLLEPIEDNKGNISSIRILSYLSFILLVYLLSEFRYAYRLEVVKPFPDYPGLALIFTAIVINFGLVILLKVIQKRYEIQ